MLQQGKERAEVGVKTKLIYIVENRSENWLWKLSAKQGQVTLFTRERLRLM